MIPLFQPTHSWRDVWAVAKVLRSKWTGVGALATQFQKAWAEHLNVPTESIVLLNSCTEALFQSVALYTKPGDTVLLPACHFIGAGNAVLGQNRRLALCDVDPQTLMPTVQNVRDSLTPGTRAVLLLHYGGQVCSDIRDIVEFCYGERVALIEDVACGPATTWRGKATGTFGDFGCWSFDSMKVLSAGDAGAAYVKDPVLARLLRLRVGCGLASSGADSKRPKWWKYRVTTYGRSSHINDITAAVLLCQLKRLPRLIRKRKGVCVQYDNALRDLPWITTRPSATEDSTDSYYFYWIQSKYRDKLAWYLREHGVFSSMRYWPLSWAYGIQGSFPGAEYAARNTLLLPCHANLSKGDVNYIVSLIHGFGRRL